MADPPFRRVAIVGLGLIGGSMALAVRRAWPSVRLLGVDATSAAVARTRGLVDEERSTIAEVQDADLIVLATPVLQILDLVAAAGHAGLEGAVTDVGSTKRLIMRAAGGTNLRFVGGHPVAGSAHRGLDHARADLFDGQPWLLVRGQTAAELVGQLDQFTRALGARPQQIDAERHDRVMAYVSHLPQLLSSALMHTAGNAVGQDGLAAAGRGFADMTRLASSPADLWQGILSTNADFVAEAVHALMSALPSDAHDLERSETVGKMLQNANMLAAGRQ
jgi:prephenate dehydrogenase